MTIKNYCVEFRIVHMVSIDTELESHITPRYIAQKAFEQMDIENNIEVVSILETDKEGFTITNEQLINKKGVIIS